MMKLIQIKPLEGYRLWLRYSDGVEGEVDLSDLAGRGVFEAGMIASFLKARGSTRAAQPYGATNSTYVLTRFIYD